MASTAPEIRGIASPSDDFKEAFSLFDKNGDGKISAIELGTVMKKMGYSPDPKELEKMIRKADLDGNGFLDFKEFKTMMIGKPISLTPDNELREIFKVMDENGDGYIGAKELRKMMKNIGQKCSKKEIKKMIEVADVNQDGKVSFEEFKILMDSTQEQKIAVGDED